MVWFGEIVDFHTMNDSWWIQVSYYDDANPTKRINRGFPLPLSSTKADVRQAVKLQGAEVRGTASLSAERLIGDTIPIP